MNPHPFRNDRLGWLAPALLLAALHLGPLAPSAALAQEEEEEVPPVPVAPGRGISLPPGRPMPGGAEPPLPPPEAGGGSAAEAETTVDPSAEERQRPPILDRNAKVTIDFVDAELTDLVKYMAEITGRNFILGDKLSGKVTIISHEKVTVSEAYEAFLSALETVGYTTVTIGKTTKVVKSGDAAKTPLRIYEGSDIPTTENFVTQIFQLDNVSVKDISAVVKELASGSARVIAYSPTNTLILTDSASNIKRIYRIISELDVAAPRSRLEIIHLTYATASEVDTIIEELYGVESAGGETSPDTARTRRRTRRGGEEAAATESTEASTTSVGDGTYISKIIADERTNSLIIKANEEAMTAILDLIKKLDVDVDPASRSQIHVIYLNHSKAEDIASVLSSLASGSVSGGSRRSSSSTSSRSPSSSSSNRRSGSSSSRGGGVSAPTGRPMMGQSGAEDLDDVWGSAGEEGGPPPQGPGAFRPPGIGNQPANSAVAAFESGMSIASDENTNSLVVIASPEDFRIIKQVIDKLDIRRKQVFVEAVVLEIASDETSDTGVGYHIGRAAEDGTLTALSSQLNGYSLGLNSADLLSGLAMGVFGPAIDVSVSDGAGGSTSLSVPAFGVALNALQSNSAVNILSTPNILTMDNEEAKIVVGRNIPFPVSTGRDTNNNPIVSYQREDVAITLKVTPQINESNFVSLEVFQEVSEIEEDSQGLDVSSAGFITSKRSAETTVVVRDNQTVVIGGLIANTDTEVETKIPVLGDIPLVGVLFRGKRIKSRKTNLLIFLTPHIVAAPEDLEEVYRVKVAQRAEFMRRFYGRSREDMEKELSSLLQYSLNLVDEPSVYRTKVDAATNVSTIESPAASSSSTTSGTTTSATNPSSSPSSGSTSLPPEDPTLPEEKSGGSKSGGDPSTDEGGN